MPMRIGLRSLLVAESLIYGGSAVSLAGHVSCRRCVPQLRCLVVLPTRDLAAQVHSVFARLCPAVGLRAGLAAAQAPVAQEAAQLFGTAHEDSCSGELSDPQCS